MALVNNRNIAHEATEKALNSEGSAMRENTAYMESYEARINLMKTAWQEFSLAMGDAIIGDTIIALTNNLTSLAGLVTKVVDKFGLMPPAIGLIGFAAAVLSKNFRETTIALLTFNKGINSLGISSGILKAKIISLGAALRGLGAATIVGAAFVALGFALEGLISKYSDYTEKLKKNREEQEKGIKSLATQPKQVEDLAKEYERLSNKTSLNKAENERLLTVQNELYQLLPSVAIAVDESGQAHLRNSEYIALEIEQLNKLYRKQDEGIAKNREENRNDLFSSIKDIESKIEEFETKIENAKLGIGGETGYESDIQNYERILEDLQYELKKSYLDLSGGVDEYAGAMLRLGYSYETLTNSDKKYLQQLASTQTESISSLETTKEQKEAYDKAQDSVVEFGKKLSSLREEMGKASYNLSPEDLLGLNQSQITTLQTISTSVKNGSKNWDSFRDSLNKAGFSGEQVGNVISSLATNISSELDESLEDVVESTDDYAKVIGSTISELTELNDIIYRVSNGQSLNGTEVDKLIRTYPELKKSIIQTADGYSFEKEAIDSVRQSKLDYLETAILAENNITSAVYANLQSRLSNYGIEISAIQSLADAKLALAKIDEENTKNNPNYELNNPNTVNESAVLSEQIRKIGEARDLFNSLYAKPTFGVTSSSNKSKSSSSSSSSSSKDNPRSQSATDAQINSIMKLAEAKAIESDATEKSISSSLSLTTQINRTTTLLESQRSEVNLLSQANDKLKKKQDELYKSNSNYSKKDMSGWLDANGEATEAYIKLYNSLSKGSQQDVLESTFTAFQKFQKQIIENNKSVTELRLSNTELNKSIEELKVERTVEYLNKLSGYVEVYNTELTKAKKIQSLYTEGSREYNEAIKEQNNILKEQQSAILKNIDWAQKKLKLDDLSAQQLSDINSFLKEQEVLLLDNIVAQNEYAKAWQDSLKSAVKDSMKVIEDYYKQQQQLEEKALDKQLKNYEDYINDRKKLLSRQDDEDDFQKDREKLQKEELEIRRKIDELMIDDSLSAKSKREDLEQDLQDKLAEIADLELDYNRKKRDQNYDDLLDEQRKEIEAEKEKLDDKWTNELNSDRYYLALKQSILEDNLTGMESALQAFADNTVSYMNKIGNAIDLNLLEKMNATQQFSDNKTNINNVLNSKPSNSATNQYDSETLAAWNEYLANKSEAEKIKLLDPARYKVLNTRNTELRKKYGFADGSYSALSTSPVPFTAETGGMTPAWGKGGKWAILHEREKVLDKVETKDILKAHEIAQQNLDSFRKIGFSLNGKNDSSSDTNYNYEYNITLHGSTSKKEKEDMLDLLEKRRRKN